VGFAAHGQFRGAPNNPIFSAACMITSFAPMSGHVGDAAATTVSMTAIGAVTIDLA
jgi:hypothetical protein